MTDRSWGLALGLLLVVPAFAGCADEPAEGAQRVGPGSDDRGSSSSPPPVTLPPKPKPSSERWHFHDHWQGEPTLVLLDTLVTLNASQGGDGLPALSAIATLPPGVIVPPETGVVTIEVSWEATQPGGLVNVTYRPADSNDFEGAADLPNAGAVNVTVSESMADVPHRRNSLWAWNLTALPGGTPPVLPAKDVRLVVKATIGRPLFIDPPHLDWWQGGDVIPLVVGASGALDSAATPVGNLTLPGDPVAARPAGATAPVRVPADPGRIVPEGTRSLVVMLNWTSEVPDAKLLVRYKEANLGTEGPLELVADQPGSRVFSLVVDNDQTDTTYSNRTTWELLVLPEGSPGAFHGTYELSAWVARVEVADVVALLAAP